MELDFSVDDELERAATLPAATYVESRWLEIERRSIFAQSWQVVGFAEHFERDGDTLATDLVGLPIVVVRDGRTLRGFHNVCRHRAGPVATGCSRRKSLQCKYHGWTYGLDGRLLRAPEMEGVKDFEPTAISLPSVRVARFGPLVLASAGQDLSELEAGLGEIAGRLGALDVDRLRHVESREYVAACNWKVYVDNYLEGYHLPHVHPALYRELDYDRYRVEPRRGYSIQHAPFRPAKGERDRRYVSASSDADAQYYWVFPNLMLNCYLGQMQLNRVLPAGADRTRIVFDWFASEPPAGAAFRRLADFSHEIQLEDERICEAVQRGLASGSYVRGRFSATREAGVHHFHRLWHEYVSTG